MFRSNSQIKRLVVIILLLFETGISYAIPLCAPQKFKFSVEDITASLAISPPGRNDDMFIINIRAKPNSDYIGKVLIIDDKCNLAYYQKLDYYPISIFSLDDGVSGVVFNLKQSGNGTYMLDAYYVENSRVKLIMANVVSKDSRPSFIDYPNPSSSAPDVRVCFKVCNIYKFDGKHKKYIKHLNP